MLDWYKDLGLTDYPDNPNLAKIHEGVTHAHLKVLHQKHMNVRRLSRIRAETDDDDVKLLQCYVMLIISTKRNLRWGERSGAY